MCYMCRIREAWQQGKSITLSPSEAHDVYFIAQSTQQALDDIQDIIERYNAYTRGEDDDEQSEDQKEARVTKN